MARFIPVLKNEDRKLLELPDCIHLLEFGRCDILAVSSCLGERCSFNQSCQDVRRSREHWKDLLKNLDIKQQYKIARKYFDGKMPWRD